MKSLASQIGYLVANTSPGSEKAESLVAAVASGSSAPLTLGETLSVWKLKDSAFAAIAQSYIEGDISNWVEKTRYLHHQIKWNSEPQGLARSSVTDSDSIALRQISASPLSSQLHKLFAMIESAPPEGFDDPVVRLLEIPPYHVSALWLFEETRNESRLIMVASPKRLKLAKPGAVLTSTEFFEALASISPIVGVDLKSASGE
ncbi:MAG: hypothetical protein WAL47_14470 [Pyrinomonadaceae bacterium]